MWLVSRNSWLSSLTLRAIPNKAELVNNYDWMKDFTFLDFAREVITVNYMMAKDSVQKRLNEARDGLSFTEFTYQLLQDTISCIFMKQRAANFRWVVRINGVILLPGPS